MQNEIWKDIPNYEGLYQVSNLGRVKRIKSLVNCRNNKTRIVPDKILKRYIDKKGYAKVSLSYFGNVKVVYVYKLVAITFLDITNYVKGMHIDHKDSNTLNDELSNLQIITHRENLSKDKFRKQKSSKYIGVSFIKSTKRWYSSIKINGKTKNLGNYSNEYDAHLAYENALNELTD